MRRTRLLLAAALVGLALSALLAPVASATFEATMAPRKPSARPDGPAFVVEAGGGRSTRIRDLQIEGGRCGSIFAALIEAGHTTSGFAGGHGVAVFATSVPGLKMRLELRVRPRGEGLTGEGVFEASSGTCHERLPLDLVSTAIRGGGRHRQG